MRHEDRVFTVDGREVVLSIHAVDRYRERTDDPLARRLPDLMAKARWSHRRPTWDKGVPLPPGLNFVGSIRLDEDAAFVCSLRFNTDGTGPIILAETFLVRPTGNTSGHHADRAG